MAGFVRLGGSLIRAPDNEGELSALLLMYADGLALLNIHELHLETVLGGPSHHCHHLGYETMTLPLTLPLPLMLMNCMMLMLMLMEPPTRRWAVHGVLASHMQKNKCHVVGADPWRTESRYT